MKVGCPKEIKAQEFRVGLTPAAVNELVRRGHFVTIETNAGQGAGFVDSDYEKEGADIVGSAKEVFDKADMIVKVKEPQAIERKMLKSGQLLFTYLHLAPDPEQTHDLIESGCTAIAYETVTDVNGGLPLLAPMSEVAGRLAPQMGAWTLQKANGGRGADVTVLDKSLSRLRYIDDVFGHLFKNGYASQKATAELASQADLIIGAVLVAGAEAPKLISKEQLSTLQPGTALVDVAIDQGGCFETSHATTHADPIYEIDGIMHYCVANMPGAVARTSTLALGNATLPFIISLADKGWIKACSDNPHLFNGLNVHDGKLTYFAVGEALGIETVKPDLKALSILH